MNRQPNSPPQLTRREAIAFLAALAASRMAHAAADPIERAIPRTGEKLPALGLGTWQVLDVPPKGADYDVALAAVRSFLESGGRLIDSSPMYGRSEERVGDMLAAIQPPDRPFLATKIWTTGQASGQAQLADSHRLMRAKSLDLVQVHNLQDLATHLATLRAAKEKGTVRYIGVTHYVASAHAELERVIRKEKPDFLQINYSLAEPEAGARLLPLARELGVAVARQPPVYERLDDRPRFGSCLAANCCRAQLSQRRPALRQMGARRPCSHGCPDRHAEPAARRRKPRGRIRAHARCWAKEGNF